MTTPTQQPTPSTPRIKADRHKEDLRILATTTPAKLPRAVVQGFGCRKAKRAG